MERNLGHRILDFLAKDYLSGSSTAIHLFLAEQPEAVEPLKVRRAIQQLKENNYILVESNYLSIGGVSVGMQQKLGAISIKAELTVTGYEYLESLKKEPVSSIYAFNSNVNSPHSTITNSQSTSTDAINILREIVSKLEQLEERSIERDKDFVGFIQVAIQELEQKNTFPQNFTETFFKRAAEISSISQLALQLYVLLTSR